MFSRMYLVLALAASASAFKVSMDRRAVISGAATMLSVPLPAVARSKEKAKEKALQKETAKEAREAMKEYKYAPRPELVGNAETGYSFKEGTVKSGSTGELASYFTEKGAVVQANYAKDKARATGASSSEADKIAAQKLAEQQKYMAEKRAKRKEMGADEKTIAAYCATPEGKAAVDNVGRKQCK